MLNFLRNLAEMYVKDTKENGGTQVEMVEMEVENLYGDHLVYLADLSALPLCIYVWPVIALMFTVFPKHPGVCAVVQCWRPAPLYHIYPSKSLLDWFADEPSTASGIGQYVGHGQTYCCGRGGQQPASKLKSSGTLN